MNFFGMLEKKVGVSRKFINYFLLKGVGEALYYFLPLVIAIFLSPAEFGVFSLSQMIVIVVVTIFITTMHTPFVVCAMQEMKKHGKINNNFTVLVIMFLASALCWFVGIVIFKDIIATFCGLPEGSVKFLSFLFFSFSIKRSFEVLLFGLDKRITSATYTFAVGVINAIIVVLLSIFFGLDIFLVFFSYFVSSVLAVIFVIGKIDKNLIFPLNFDVKQFRETLQWVKWQVFGLLAIYMIDWGDNIILRLYVSMEEIGVYNTAYQLFKGIAGITLILNMYFLPYLSKHINNKKKIAEYLSGVRSKIMALCVCGVAVAFFAAPVFYGYLYGSEYGGAADVFRVLVLAFIPFVYIMLLVPFYNSLKNYRFIQTVSVVQVILNIALDLLFVERYGMIGAAYGTLVAYVFAAILYFLYHKYKIIPIYLSRK